MPSGHGSSRCCRTGQLSGRWRDHRQVIDAIAFKYRTGTPWMDLPENFGSWKGAHNRLRKWAADGTWEKVFTTLLAQSDAEGDLEWVVAVDSWVIHSGSRLSSSSVSISPKDRTRSAVVSSSGQCARRVLRWSSSSGVRPAGWRVSQPTAARTVGGAGGGTGRSGRC
ncbi:transposase [Streptomyces sp. NPDC059389]|uniref:transposase n=1 Tax=Streptomyces sp. NPDC059389 TaxID=3346818 RepID=UPI00369DF363